MIILKLPYPISANRYWKSFSLKGRIMTAPSKEASAYKAEVAAIIAQAGIRKPIPGRVSIGIQLYPQRPKDWESRIKKYGSRWDDTVRCIDLDNARKVLYDSIKRLVIEDDKWVFFDSAKRMTPDGDARVIMQICPMMEIEL